MERAGEELSHLYPRGPELPEPRPGVFWAYILECSDGTFYTGQTNNVPRRMAEHRRGSAARYTGTRLPVRLVHYEPFSTRREAMRRERQLRTTKWRNWRKREYRAGRLRGQAIPVAYLWARTIRCEGEGCNAEVPLIPSTRLAHGEGRRVALRLVPNRAENRAEVEVIEGAGAEEAEQEGGATVRDGSATCPLCGHTTPAESVREQAGARAGARLLAVVERTPGGGGPFYRLPTAREVEAADDFTPRQSLAMATLARLVREVSETGGGPSDEARSYLEAAVTRLACHANSPCGWDPAGEEVIPSATALVFAEVLPFSPGGWGFEGALRQVCEQDADAVQDD